MQLKGGVCHLDRILNAEENTDERIKPYKRQLKGIDFESSFADSASHQSGNLRPKSLNDYIGQEGLKKNISVFIKSAKKRKAPLDHMLFYGPPGLGKTTIAGVIASEMGVNMKITTGPAIEKGGDIAALLNGIQENDIVFIDEIHRLNKAVEEVLYPAMEDFAIDIMIGSGTSGKSIRLDLPHFTLIGATTRAGMLSAPLRDRFGSIMRLELYSPKELGKIVKRDAEIGRAHV